MRKIDDSGIKSFSSKISQEIQTIKDEYVNFSFKYLDSSNEKFKFDDKDCNYYTKLIMRIKDVSAMRALDLKSDRSKTLKCHSIDWNHKKITETSFNIPGEDKIVSNPFQFALSKNEHGRVHGFFIGNVFFIRWFDPNHSLYSGDADA
jgi:hypothetical protein